MNATEGGYAGMCKVLVRREGKLITREVLEKQELLAFVGESPPMPPRRRNMVGAIIFGGSRTRARMNLKQLRDRFNT